jgi:hypothetical protein
MLKPMPNLGPHDAGWSNKGPGTERLVLDLLFNIKHSFPFVKEIFIVHMVIFPLYRQTAKCRFSNLFIKNISHEINDQ